MLYNMAPYIYDAIQSPAFCYSYCWRVFLGRNHLHASSVANTAGQKMAWCSCIENLYFRCDNGSLVLAMSLPTSLICTKDDLKSWKLRAQCVTRMVDFFCLLFHEIDLPDLIDAFCNLLSFRKEAKSEPYETSLQPSALDKALNSGNQEQGEFSCWRRTAIQFSRVQKQEHEHNMLNLWQKMIQNMSFAYKSLRIHCASAEH